MAIFRLCWNDEIPQQRREHGPRVQGHKMYCGNSKGKHEDSGPSPTPKRLSNSVTAAGLHRANKAAARNQHLRQTISVSCQKLMPVYDIG
jgi:hypothetical protein